MKNVQILHPHATHELRNAEYEAACFSPYLASFLHRGVSNWESGSEGALVSSISNRSRLAGEKVSVKDAKAEMIRRENRKDCRSVEFWSGWIAIGRAE